MKNNLPDNQSNFLLYTSNTGDIKVDVFFKDETIWLTQKAIGELFGKDRSVVTKHLKNIFDSGELDEKSNVQKMHILHPMIKTTFPILMWRLRNYQKNK